MRTHHSVAEPAPFQNTVPMPIISHITTSTAMYPRAFRKNGLAKHAHKCKAAFGKYDPRCHRCVELVRGAVPRGSWHDDFYAKKLGEVQRSFEW